MKRLPVADLRVRLLLVVILALIPLGILVLYDALTSGNALGHVLGLVVAVVLAVSAAWLGGEWLILRQLRTVRQAEVLQRALYRIAETAQAAEDMPEFYAALHQIVGELMYARNFYISMYDAAAGMLSYPYYVDEVDAPPAPEPLGKTLTGYVVRSGQPLLAPEDVFLSMIERGAVECVGAPSIDWLGVPLKRGDATCGALVVQSYSPKFRFEPAGKKLLTFVSQHISIALARKQAQEALRASEERYRTLVEDAPIGIYRTTPGPHGRFLLANRALLAMFGYPSIEALLATPVSAVYQCPDERQRFSDLLLTRGSVTGCELQVVKRDGTPMWGSVTARVVEREQDQIAYFDCMIEDITERKRAEAAEREQRAFAEALRDTAAAFASTLGYEEVLDLILAEIGRVVPHDCANILLIEDDEVCVVRGHGYVERNLPSATGLMLSLAGTPSLRQMYETGRPLIIPDTRLTPDWIQIAPFDWICSCVGAPIRCKGRITGFLNLDSAHPGLYTVRDLERLQAFADQAGMAIENARLYNEVRGYAADLENRVAERTTELRQTTERLRETAAGLEQREAALQAANLRLQELDRLKSGFISNISHELRTPLANIKLYLSLLEHGKPEKQDHYLATLRREADLLHHLIEQVLDLSFIDLNRDRVVLQPVDVAQLLESLERNQAALTASRGLNLHVEPSSGLPLAMGRPKMLAQVLTNLVTNAMNYTQAGGTITIETGQAVKNGRTWITIAVHDTGPGIPSEDQVHMFERFYRGASGRASGQPGTGLGLAVSREIVERLGGEISVASEPGQGSTFTVWLILSEN
jgi:PAS domain S-box-containing protein